MKIININGVIGFESSYAAFSADLMSAAGEDVTIIINSPGGAVTEGFAMVSATRAYKAKYPTAKIITELRGQAASMAPVVAGSKSIDIRRAEDNATFMVHNPYMFAAGDYRDMEAVSEILSNYSMLYAKSLADRNTAGKTEKEIRAMMDKAPDGTWLFGAAIKAAGFVDEIIPAGDGAEDEPSAMAMSRAEFVRCQDMMRSAKNQEDASAVALAAAMLSALPGASGKINTPPAGGQQEETEMLKTLMEFQAQGAEALAEVNKLKDDIAKAAVQGERERVKALSDMKAKAGKIGAVAELVDAAMADGRTAADIAVAVSNLAIAAADSAGAIGTGGTADPEPVQTGWAVNK